MNHTQEQQQKLSAAIESGIASTLGGMQLKLIELSRTLSAVAEESAQKDARIAELESMLDAEVGARDEEA